MAPNPFVDRELAALREGGYRGPAWRAFGRALAASAGASAAARPELARELGLARLGALAVAAAVSLALLADGVPALGAVPLPALAALLLLAWVGVELGLVRHPLTGVPSPAIGPANLMSLFRGWAAVPVLLLGLSLRRPDWLWFGLCLAAGLTDLFDGTVAGRLGQESRLGRLLDPVMDACFFSAAAAGVARWGLMPAWLAALVALRYFVPVLGGLALMLARGRTLPVRHTAWGQRSTLAIGLALTLTWLSSLVALPAPLLPAIYAVALATMALALAGILRRAPVGAVADPGAP
ncbi:MAG TPA: CDP-alcohol phosphatidyltransferase family protein [Candidatus Dormibacteraeota bacterium]|nr:CDP-alcohol phosphatidyltransferase family protein [Candidatus Dormibacteraeota bacterium]